MFFGTQKARAEKRWLLGQPRRLGGIHVVLPALLTEAPAVTFPHPLESAHQAGPPRFSTHNPGDEGPGWKWRGCKLAGKVNLEFPLNPNTGGPR